MEVNDWLAGFVLIKSCKGKKENGERSLFRCSWKWGGSKLTKKSHHVWSTLNIYKQYFSVFELFKILEFI